MIKNNRDNQEIERKKPRITAKYDIVEKANNDFCMLDMKFSFHFLT